MYKLLALLKILMNMFKFNTIKFFTVLK
jgi:hypothetical protein